MPERLSTEYSEKVGPFSRGEKYEMLKSGCYGAGFAEIMPLGPPETLPAPRRTQSAALRGH